MQDANHNEEWRPVVGFEGVYSVSSLGDIRRDGRIPGAVVGKILRPTKHGSGYKTVHLQGGNRKKTRTVHRIVLSAFTGHEPVGLQVNHINGNKTDNRLCNLEWVTRSENQLHAIKVLGRRRKSQ